MSSPFSTNNQIPPTQGGPVAQITIGEISPTDNEALYKDDGQDATIWTDCVITNHYEKDHHRWMMAVSSPGGFNGQSVAFAQTANATLLWVTDWTIAKFGIQPEIPNPDVGNSDWVLLDEVYEPDTVVTAADGRTPLYRISGTYVYGHKNPNSTTVRNINFALPPWLENYFDRSVPTSALTQNMININGISLRSAIPSAPGR